MKIGIDARELQGQPTGVGRYLSALLTAWKEIPEARAHEIVLFAPRPGDSRGLAWEQIALPRMVSDAKADVLFSPGYTAPIFCPAPLVATVHDVSFVAHPEWFGRKEGLRRRVLTRLTARRACKVLTVSEFSKGEIVAHLGVDARKVEVVYNAVNTAGREGLRRIKQSERRNLVLYVGSLFNRRHLPELIEGFGRLALQIGRAHV